MFYLICNNLDQRNKFLNFLENRGIIATFHYQSLHKSPFFINKHDGRTLSYSDIFSNCLVRLPIFFDLKNKEQLFVIESILKFFRNKN